MPPLPAVDNTGAMMIVRRIREDYQNCSVLCCVIVLLEQSAV